MVNRLYAAVPLPLTRRKPRAIFTERRVIALGQAHDEIMDIGKLGGLLLSSLPALGFRIPRTGPQPRA